MSGFEVFMLVASWVMLGFAVYGFQRFVVKIRSLLADGLFDSSSDRSARLAVLARAGRPRWWWGS